MPAHAPILLAGPTASGKSAFALALAHVADGVIVNADSMQVYREAPVLTAQPTAQDMAKVPHRLYGHVPGSDAYSTGRYIADVQRVLAEVAALGKTPIIVGGTGLYFKALTEGLSPVPPIPSQVRVQCRALADAEGAAGVRAALLKVDPVMAARLDANDAQRLVRALEVIAATGRSLADWQTVQGTPTIDPGTAISLVIDRPRAELQARADRRFDQMMTTGALDEVHALAALGLSSELPLMRALGVRPLLDHVVGVGADRPSLDAAIAAGKLETRQYIKRQQTWLKRHMMSWRWASKQETENPAAFFEAMMHLRR